MPLEPVTPSIGWGVLHLFFRVDRARAEQEPGAAKRIVDAVASLEADGHQALVFAVLGHKADLGVMALGPDLARLHAFQQELLAGPLLPEYSFVSLTELSEYSATEDDERARLRDEEGITDPAEIEARLAVVARADRALPREPASTRSSRSARLLVLLPDVEAPRPATTTGTRCRSRSASELMAGHARVGRTYAGRVLQLITGSVGLDDWEWGVTLLADDPVVLKEIVNEMRFDEVSARYGEFGPFFTGLLLDPADALERVGLR